MYAVIQKAVLKGVFAVIGKAVKTAICLHVGVKKGINIGVS